MPNLLDEYEAPKAADLTSEYEAPSHDDLVEHAIDVAMDNPIDRALQKTPIAGIRRDIARKMLEVGGKKTDIALNVVLPILGTLGGAELGPAGAAIGGGTTSAAVDRLVQAREMARGERSDLSTGQTIASGLVGAFVPKPVQEAGTALGTIAKTVGIRAGQGAVLGGGHELISDVIDKQPVDWGKVISSAEWGTAFGAGAGTLEKAAPAAWNFVKGLGTATPKEALDKIGTAIADAKSSEEKAQLQAVDGQIRKSLGLAPANFIGIQEGIPEAGIPHRELFNVNGDVAGTVSGSTVSRQTLENAGYTVPELPKIKPGVRVDIPLSDIAEGRLPLTPEEQQVRASDFMKARAEEAVQTIKANQLAGDESIIADLQPLPDDARITVMEMGGRRATQIEIPGAQGERPAFSGSAEQARAEGYDVQIPSDLPQGQYNYSKIKTDETGYSGSQESPQRQAPFGAGQEASRPGQLEQGLASDQTQNATGPDSGSLTDALPVQGADALPIREASGDRQALGEGISESGSQGPASTQNQGQALAAQNREGASVGPQLSHQAQRIYDQYGSINPVLARSLTAGAGGVGGFAYGANQNPNDSVDKRIENGLTYAVLGAAGGYMLGNSFNRLAESQPNRSSNPALQKWYNRLSEVPESGGWVDQIKNLPNRLRTALGTSFAPLDKLPGQIQKARESIIGPLVPMREQHIPLSRQFELVNGASGKAQVDVEDYAKSVIDQLKPGELKDFNVLLAVKRTGQRLQADQLLQAEQARIKTIPANQRTPQEIETLARTPNQKRVAGETLQTVDDALQALRGKLGQQRFNELDQLAAGSFQQSADKALQLLVSTGRMSPAQYAQIKSSNDFYAPFRVLEAAEDFDGFRGIRTNPVDTTTKYTHAIEGIDSLDFHLDDPTKVLAEKIYQARILGEKNLKMNVLARMADEDPAGTVIRKLRSGESAPRGMDTVNYFDSGTPRQLAVSPAVSEAVKGLNPAQTGVIAQFIRKVNQPFRFLATSGNVGFQAVNAPFDQLRLATTSKYGVHGGSLVDALQYPTDFIHSVYSAITGPEAGPRAVGAVTGFYTGYQSSDGDTMDKLKSGVVGAAIGSVVGQGARKVLPSTQLYRQFYESGAAGSTMQDMVNRLSGEKFSVLNEATGPVRGVINTLADFGKAVEESTKLLGFKRGLRIEGVGNLPPQQAAQKLEQVVSEVRNFAGSPDFAVSGNLVRDLNSAIVFLSPRIQGMSEDIARLAGRDGASAAAKAWAGLGTTAGLGALMLWASNNKPENKADYAQVSDQEKQNYAMIPRYDDKGQPLYFTNERGQKVRDYWRIPLRDTAQTLYHMVQNGMDFANNTAPQQTGAFATQLLEDLSPINFQGKNTQQRIESTISQFGPAAVVPYELASGRNPGLHSDIIKDDRMKKASPENQFETNTPEGYKQVSNVVPQFLADPLRSPLMLQAMTQAMTGGALNQFTPNKPLPDRDPLANTLASSPLTRRFERSTYVNSVAPAEADKAVQNQANEQVSQTRNIRTTYDQIMAQPAEKRGLAFLALPKDTQQELEKEFMRRSRAPHDAEISDVKQLEVTTGARAKYIYDRVMTMPVAERGQFVQELEQSNLLTPEVKHQITLIAVSKASNQANSTRRN